MKRKKKKTRRRWSVIPSAAMRRKHEWSTTKVYSTINGDKLTTSDGFYTFHEFHLVGSRHEYSVNFIPLAFSSRPFCLCRFVLLFIYFVLLSTIPNECFTAVPIRCSHKIRTFFLRLLFFRFSFILYFCFAFIVDRNERNWRNRRSARIPSLLLKCPSDHRSRHLCSCFLASSLAALSFICCSDRKRQQHTEKGKESTNEQTKGTEKRRIKKKKQTVVDRFRSSCN